jgi:hypothetical protein
VGVEGKIQEGFRGIGLDHGFILCWTGKVWAAVLAGSRAQTRYHPQALLGCFQMDL